MIAIVIERFVVLCLKARVDVRFLPLVFVALFLTVAVPGFADDNPASPASLASTLLSQIDRAVETMRQEFGPSVFADNRGDLSSPRHGLETIGEAWKRHLVEAGVPNKVSDREVLAKTIGLDPRASLVLVATAARIDAIDYLRSELRRLAGEN